MAAGVGTQMETSDCPDVRRWSGECGENKIEGPRTIESRVRGAWSPEFAEGPSKHLAEG